ncbi:hypothetical protein [Paraburkholderia sp. J11-2]|uniref:hypothetical protein n=1 Tax=Paraburkholderia sp. J11-2 TaxID=2805431 RepID=UPI002AB69DE1|nr:hypothetical protein [Paraburkholderia sp. J11-2]
MPKKAKRATWPNPVESRCINACLVNLFHGEFSLTKPASTPASCGPARRTGQVNHFSGNGVRNGGHAGYPPMFKRILFELARVFVPDERNPDSPALIDLSRSAFDTAAIEAESTLSRLRDSAGTRAARSRRRVWRLREVRREFRREVRREFHHIVQPVPRF